VVFFKGPASAKNKKLFYVYGRGWNAMDGNRTLPTLTKEEGEDYSWPQRRRVCIYKNKVEFFLHTYWETDSTTKI
jgi:hypothetical protein